MAWAILAAYCGVLVKIMVFKDIPTVSVGQVMLDFAGTDAGHGPNFVPFRTILPYLLGEGGLIIAGINLAGNVLLLVPVGLLLPFVRPSIGWKGVVAVGVASGLGIEAMQSGLQVGIFDIDDVILNALGVMVGYWAWAVVAGWVREGRYGIVAVAACLVVIAGAAAFYAVYPWGQPVDPPEDAGLLAEEEGLIPEGGDLCGGTGGTGQIIATGDRRITIRRQDEVVEDVTLTQATTIRTSAGPAVEGDLRIGDRVTVVVDETETAAVVLVCAAG